ncbi:uncharacterized protein LOC130636988 [Hydractinia symbiolongicarpus]|uniref:uncharacterized protein LOC130636988 n=1 Tax=Hydractinia symbiolongicarpus TaxID=13093 RepID=UPI00254E2933|nr:uncharacterized protein LOC130636988 [Hydractinia symbiolongicarpus]
MDEDVDLEEALQSDVLFQELLKNEIFDDYFNTFLSLPIFARRLMYRRDNGLFEIEPPVKRTTHHLLHDKVISWIRIHRGPYFLKTSICNEYRLCRVLAALPVCFKYESVSNEELHQLQKKYLSKVIDIQRLKKYFNGSIGEYLLQFWLDAERYRRQVPENCRKFVLREIQKKFLTEGATHALNISLFEKINSHLKEKMDKSAKNLSTILISPQQIVMKNLMEYWIPKYIIHRLRRRTTAVSRWGKLLKAKDKLPTEVGGDESGEKPHLVTAVINEMKEKMKKKNEELRQKKSSQKPEISAPVHGHVTSTSSSSGEEDEEVYKENGNQQRKQILNSIKNKREKQKEMEDAISDLTIIKNGVRTKSKLVRGTNPQYFNLTDCALLNNFRPPTRNQKAECVLQSKKNLSTSLILFIYHYFLISKCGNELDFFYSRNIRNLLTKTF